MACLLLICFFHTIINLGEHIESALLDARLRYRAQSRVPSSDIIIVGLDQRTDEWRRRPDNPDGWKGSVPPRRRLADVIRYLTAQGARAITLDIVLSDPQSPEDDQALANAIQQSGRVYLGASMEQPLSEMMRQVPRNFDKYTTRHIPATQPSLMASEPDNPLKKRLQAIYTPLCLQHQYEKNWQQGIDLLEKASIPFRYGIPPENTLEQGFTYCKMSPLQPGFLSAARGMGVTSVEYEQEGFLREAPVFFKGYQGRFFATLTVRTALDSLVSNNGPLPEMVYSRNALQLGKRLIPLWDGRNVMLDWRNPRLLAESIYQEQGYALPREEADAIRPDTVNPALGYGHLYRLVSVADILKKLRNPNNTETPSLYALYNHPESGPLPFKGKWVIYGDTIHDRHRTPVGEITYGPEVMATLLDMFLNNREFIRQTPLPAVILVTILFAYLMASMIHRLSRLESGVTASICLLAAFWAGNFLLFRHAGLFLPLLWPTVLFLSVIIGALVYRYYVQDHEKRQLAGVFSKFVSPQVMRQILDNPADTLNNLKGSRKELTVLFSDIHNFTASFEHEDPELIVQRLNEYFNVMTAIVLKHGGTYDKYMGDALMAFFGAPTELPDHAERACRAALEMQAAMAPFNERWTAQGHPPLKHGIGISTGTMLVGYFGSDDIKNFTVLGGDVNLGARLETYTRLVDANILISEQTYKLVHTRIQCRDLGHSYLKGFSQPIHLYALEGEHFEPDKEGP